MRAQRWTTIKKKERERRKRARDEEKKRRKNFEEQYVRSKPLAFRNQFNLALVERGLSIRSIETAGKSYGLMGSASIQMSGEGGKSVFIVNAVNEIGLLD